MPQDKRLLITKAVVFKVQRVAGSSDAAKSVGVNLEFVAPPIIFQKDPSIASRIFGLAHPTFPKDGRSTVLIVPKAVVLDCSKINKRHGYFDAVVAAEAVCRRGDADSEARALQVSKAFQHFIVDARIVSKLPPCILDACGGSTGGSAATSSKPRKMLSPLAGLEDRDTIANRLATMGRGALLTISAQGHCRVRIGHGGMTAGDVCENAKEFISAVKRDIPHLWKFIEEFKLTTAVTDSIRFMEVGIHK
mmetsp:Transcript_10907/g.12532  ORF Transcript_10907/g.12532 Transcript_10907/m.12532 type:complete len:249 (+) Transcript_10907:34-780(+)